MDHLCHTRGLRSLEAHFTKGHAEAFHIAAGSSSHTLRAGNDVADLVADRGRLSRSPIESRALGVLAKRFEGYAKFIASIQTMMLAIIRDAMGLTAAIQLVSQGSRGARAPPRPVALPPIPPPGDQAPLRRLFAPSGLAQWSVHSSELQVREYILGLSVFHEVREGFGTSWIELFVDFLIEGHSPPERASLSLGARRSALEAAPPLKESLELFKKLSRVTAKQFVHPELRSLFAPAKLRGPRLASLAINSHVAAIPLCPAWSEAKRSRIAESLLRLKSGFKPAWIQEWRSGTLMLAPGPLSLRGKIPPSAFRA